MIWHIHWEPWGMSSVLYSLKHGPEAWPPPLKPWVSKAFATKCTITHQEGREIGGGVLVDPQPWTAVRGWWGSVLNPNSLIFIKRCSPVPSDDQYPGIAENPQKGAATPSGLILGTAVLNTGCVWSLPFGAPALCHASPGPCLWRLVYWTFGLCPGARA